MSMNFRFPNITTGTPAQQIAQIHSFLRQLVGQLNWAFENYNTGIGGQGAETLSEGDITAIKEVVGQRKADDFIFSVSESETECGVWRKEIMKSGQCRLTGNFTVIPDAPELDRTLYMTNPFSIPLPCGVKSGWVIGTAKGRCFVASEGISKVNETVDGQSVEKYYVSFRLISDAQLLTTGAIEVALAVTGTYVT